MQRDTVLASTAHLLHCVVRIGGGSTWKSSKETGQHLPTHSLEQQLQLGICLGGGTYTRGQPIVGENEIGGQVNGHNQENDMLPTITDEQINALQERIKPKANKVDERQKLATRWEHCSAPEKLGGLPCDL